MAEKKFFELVPGSWNVFIKASKKVGSYYPFGLTMAGISDKAAGGLENKYKYNGIELDTSLGLDEYEASLRDLDPQTGRWWQIDPETEDQEMWSTYTSNNDNPILYQDPRGNEGEACCQWFSDIVTTVVATTSVAVDNVLGTNVTGKIANSGAIPSSQIATWNNAVTTANQTSLVAGTAAAVIGGGVAAGGEGATVVTGGLSSEVTVPVAAVGLGVAVAGTWVAANATKNLQKGNGLITRGQTSSGHPTDQYGNKLGPSGKPQVNKVRHSTLKGANDTARNSGKGAPVKHSSPKIGSGHYHPMDKNGKKIPNSTHHEYPQ